MTNGEKIRVLIADDSAFMRKVLVSILDSDGSFEVVGEARDGRETVEKSAKLKPQVITMDINMPHMDGLQATEVIMSTDPRPILIVSSESRDGAEATLRALELGAIDFVAKPSSGVDLDMLFATCCVRLRPRWRGLRPRPWILPPLRLRMETGCRWLCWQLPQGARQH